MTKQNLGYFFIAMDIAKFTDVDFFKNRVDQMIDEIKANQKAPGVDTIYMPGEIEFISEEENRKKGVEAGPGVMADLAALCGRYGVNRDPADCILNKK
jgi:LDH2 family malate/lactate/ureidoglycolate dehydrogenase